MNVTWTLGLLLGVCTIACAGEQGPAGPPGPAGPAGPQGASVADDAGASSFRIVRSIGCFGGLEGTPLSFAYTVALTEDGTIFASAEVRDAAIGASFANVYAPTQNGAATAQVLVSLDELPPANGGFFAVTLDRSTLVTTIVYHDTDVAGGTRTWTMTPDKCVSNTY